MDTPSATRPSHESVAHMGKTSATCAKLLGQIWGNAARKALPSRRSGESNLSPPSRRLAESRLALTGDGETCGRAAESHDRWRARDCRRSVRGIPNVREARA